VSDVVTSGLFYGFTRAQVEAERVKYVAAVQAHTAHKAAAGGGVVSSGTFGGKTVVFAFPAGVTSFEEWRQSIDDALSQLDGNGSTMTDRAVPRWR
jgi:hypothetical protein